MIDANKSSPLKGEEEKYSPFLRRRISKRLNPIPSVIT
tara:strand:- start:818 stop:931 length:114 start_codon:yes stop_codon:yes gene_type:complete